MAILEGYIFPANTGIIQQTEEKEYTCITTYYTIGQTYVQLNKKEVKKYCEEKRIKIENNAQKYGDAKCIRIEVMNNKTGEIREYWNNQDNTIKF